MKRRNYNFYIRKAHRYMGLFIGIQFILWTSGGLFFSWFDIKEIRGEHLRNMRQDPLSVDEFALSPGEIPKRLLVSNKEGDILRLRAVEVLGSRFYEVALRNGETESFVLVNAADGSIRPAITEEEAGRIAADALVDRAGIVEIAYLTNENVGVHHEYREKPLPAWAVTFEKPAGLTVYLSAETGEIGAFRTNNWRVYDFLWMLHTMGYGDRDNFNNYILRAFSALAFVTVLSGFLLFFMSSRTLKRMIRGDTVR